MSEIDELRATIERKEHGIKDLRTRLSRMRTEIEQLRAENDQLRKGSLLPVKTGSNPLK